MVVLSTKTLTGMSCLKVAYLDSGCYQKALRNWDGLLKLVKAHKKKPSTLVDYVVVVIFPGKE